MENISFKRYKILLLYKEKNCCENNINCLKRNFIKYLAGIIYRNDLRVNTSQVFQMMEILLCIGRIGRYTTSIKYRNNVLQHFLKSSGISFFKNISFNNSIKGIVEVNTEYGNKKIKDNVLRGLKSIKKNSVDKSFRGSRQQNSQVP